MVEHKSLPERGQNPLLLRLLQCAFRSFDVDYSKGFVLAYVYKYTSTLDQIQKDAYMRFLSENGLDPTAFPSLIKFETEVVSMIATHLHAPPTAAGSFTSGGTESCMLSMITARNWSRDVKKVHRPSIVLPRTAHPAFHKAAELMDLPVIIVEVDPETMLPSVADIRGVLTKNKEATILVGSAGAYSHGVMDPIEGMAALAKEFNVWLHVDGCIGGFVLQYFREFGMDVPLFDFRVEGVSSMSLDLHKYAFCAKGASTVIYRTKALRRYQIFANSEWIGYPMVNPTLQSTKSGGPMAAAWTTLCYLGQEGYRSIMKDMYEGTMALIQGIPKIKGYKIIGTPKASLVGFTTVDREINLFHIQDLMKKKGWHVQAQTSYGPYREHLHVTVNPQMKANAPFFLKCLAESLEQAKGMPRYLEDVAYVKKYFEGKTQLLEEDYITLSKYVGMSPTDLPDGMARLNTMMEALPIPMRKEMMIYFSNDLLMHDEIVSRKQVEQLKGMIMKKARVFVMHVGFVAVIALGYKRLLFSS
jgi:glutamate/tyrosine decarboxylase-like PLP-dependent enzyme